MADAYAPIKPTIPDAAGFEAARFEALLKFWALVEAGLPRSQLSAEAQATAYAFLALAALADG